MEGSLYRSFINMNRRTPYNQPAPPQPASCRRQSMASSSRRSSTDTSSSTRRSSTDTSASFFTQNNNSGGYFFSLRHTDVMGSSNRSLNTRQADSNNWTPNRVVCGPRSSKNTKTATVEQEVEQQGHDVAGGGQCSQPNQEYTATDRAQRISKSSRLGNLLSAEVEKAGVVTAAGYRAVHQKFLYSEAVEQEMKTCAPQSAAAVTCRRSRGGGGLEKLRSSRFGNLLARSTDSRSEFLEETDRHQKTNKKQEQIVAKKLSSGSGNTSCTAASSSNALAGRRSSQVCALSNSQQEMLQQETQDYQDKERRKLMMDSFARNLDGEDDDDEESSSSSEQELEEVDQHKVDRDELSMDSSLYSQDSFVQSLRGTTKEIVGERTSWPRDVSSSSSTNRRNRSSSFHASSSRRASLDLDDIFDGVDGSQLLSELLAQGEAAQKQPRQDTATCTTKLSRLESLSDRFNEVHFDPEEQEEAPPKSGSQGKDLQDEQELRSSDQSFDHSCTDSCGWLPWPERKSESSNQCRRRSSIEYHNRRRSSIDRGAVGELLESFVSSPNYSSGGEDDEAFLPWVTIPNDNRARAA